ncbi:hypothetical protein [Arenimonas sp.]|uniref:hypothetical protein n=1 Tax=Arenimonas sp. TaxID=1872635 RepID=UPI0025C0A709|nr:hypothetical protein [Arenimonas sp.]
MSCPACGAELTLDAMLSHDAARRAVAAAMVVSPALADRLMKYLGLFRPAKRQLTMDRVATLLEELLPMLQSQTVSRAGREYSTIPDTWKQALDQMLRARDANKLTLPLKSHGYLLEIVIGLCEAFERLEEERREQSRRTPHRSLQEGAQAVAALQGLAEQAAARSEAPAPVPAPSHAPRQVPAGAKHVLAGLGVGRRRATGGADEPQ